MFKKLVIGCAVLAATSTVAFADGAYVGGDLGLNSNTFKLVDPTSSTTNFNNRELTLGGLAGYGVSVSDLIYLGGEAFLNGGSSSTSTKSILNGSQTAKLTSTYSYGLDFVPGIKVTQSTMVYGKMGLSESRFKLTENIAPGFSSGVSGTAAQNRLGGRLGLGAQTDVSSNFAVRGEFVHTAYRGFSAPSNTGFQNRITPKTNTATVGLVDKFD
jgi:outer membrane immunogenic protein